MKNKILSLILCVVFITPVYALDQATFKVGKNFFERGLYTEAERRFLDIVRKYPDSSLYHQSLFYLGQTYVRLGKYKSALQYYKLLLTKSKTIKEKQHALLGIAKSWLQLGVHDKAGDFYAFFASEYPESEYAPAALYFSGIARERGNDNSAAVEKYRAVLNEYPDSEYYAKAIEKVAVLDSTTPESLWDYTTVRQQETNSSIWDPGFEQTDFKAQSTQNITNSVEGTVNELVNISPQRSTQTVSPQLITQFVQIPAIITQMVESPIQKPQIVTQIIESPPRVITQMVDSPPVIITQKITQVITQRGSDNRNDLDMLSSSDVVQQKDGVFIPVTIAEDQLKKQRELESYKTMWEEEYRLKIKEQELQQAQQDVKELAQLSADKAEVLKVKELSLKEQQDRIRNNIYRELSSIKKETNSQVFDSVPLFTQGIPPEPAVQEVPIAPVTPPVEQQPVEQPAEEIVEDAVPVYNDEYYTNYEYE